jgi:hypothetical protein
MRVSRLPDLDDFLDPKTLTPQGLYRLQSDTWAQGAEFERNRIIKLLKPHAEHDEDMCYFEGKRECYPEDCSAPLIQWVIALIKGEQK